MINGAAKGYQLRFASATRQLWHALYVALLLPPPIFFGVGILTALSFLAAEKLAKRIGLVKTMVFSHLPSNVFSDARSFCTEPGGGDVPTRQSYTIAIVSPEERVAAASFSNVSRNVAQAISPSFSGYVLQFLSLSFPFLIDGGLKIAYGISLYMNFRSLKPPEENKFKGAEGT